ncbi:MAG: arsenosugar biosynthesis-associated peroxidase-like protein [Finegoldia sp.]|nr:arsenosugar biosynthesis-associated peroxidase-like protein [Finegoldia sp.]
MSKDFYFDREDLNDFNNAILAEDSPEYWEKFMTYYGSVFEDGALTAREKKLIALAVASLIGCPYCVEAYTKACLSEGCDKDEMTEAVHAAAALRAGATLAQFVQGKKLADKLSF